MFESLKELYVLHEKLNNRKFWVRKDLKGRNKEFLLCTNCKKKKDCFKFIDQKKLARLHSFTLVVWECLDFVFDPFVKTKVKSCYHQMIEEEEERCSKCYYKRNNPDPGHCYMFKNMIKDCRKFKP